MREERSRRAAQRDGKRQPAVVLGGPGQATREASQRGDAQATLRNALVDQPHGQQEKKDHRHIGQRGAAHRDVEIAECQQARRCDRGRAAEPAASHQPEQRHRQRSQNDPRQQRSGSTLTEQNHRPLDQRRQQRRRVKMAVGIREPFVRKEQVRRVDTLIKMLDRDAAQIREARSETRSRDGENQNELLTCDGQKVAQ